ncbi:MAG: sortase [Chloroflexota bacterium]|nr:sortase [Chloroflexota bacterium]
MYHQRRNRPTLLLPIVLGILLGGGFLFFSLWQSPPTPALETLPLAPSLATAQPTDAPTPTAATSASPIARARLELPNAGVVAPIIDVYIREGTWDVANIGASVGHLQGTASLGMPGNIGLAGHSELRDGSRGIFAYIQQLNYSDPIHVEHNNTVYEYRVTAVQRVDPTDLSVLEPTTTDRLTLITCDEYDFLLDFYRVRVVVIAERV